MWSALKKLFGRGPASIRRALFRGSGRGRGGGAGGRGGGSNQGHGSGPGGRRGRAAVPIPGRDLIEQLKSQFDGADDVKFRFLSLGEERAEAAVVYIDGLVDGGLLEQTLLRPLLRWSETASRSDIAGFRRDPWLFGQSVFTAGELNVAPGLEGAAEALLRGDVIFAFRGHKHGLQVVNRGWESRGVEDPLLEVTVRGPRDSFTENLLWNTALLRRRIRDPQLRVKIMSIGRRSRTSVALVHIEGIAPGSLVDEVRNRLESIDIDGVLDTGYIEHMIEDEWWSPFPQHLKTERPDKAAAAPLEGRVAVFADTTPFVLMMPATLDSLFHSPEDSYDRWFHVNLLRWVRFLGSVFSVVTPALYVALVAYHPGILPTEFTLRLMASREGVAFPVVFEALIMQFMLELIKEAGFRMPSPIGQTFGIVGGLVLGEMGVRAGIVSEAMVIVVAVTAVSSFAAVDRETGTVLRLLGLPMMISAAVLGLYGLAMALLLILIHLACMRSYGVPYIAPYPYYKWSDMKDTLLKAPMRSFHRRPSHLHAPDEIRMGDHAGDLSGSSGGGRPEDDVDDEPGGRV